MNTTTNNTPATKAPKALSKAVSDALVNAAKNYAASEELAALTDKGMAQAFGVPDENGCPKMTFVEFEQRRVAFEGAYREEKGCNQDAANKAFGRAYKSAGYEAKPKAATKDAERKAGARGEVAEVAQRIASGAASTDMIAAQAVEALNRKQEAEKVAKLAKGKEAEKARAAQAEAAKQERELMAALKVRRAAEKEASGAKLKAIKEDAKEWTVDEWVRAAQAVAEFREHQ